MLSNKRPICESCLSIDVRRWHRDGLLRSSRTFTWTWSSDGELLARTGVAVDAEGVLLTFEWRHRGASESAQSRQRMPLTWTKCHLGGVRPWFLCPENTGEGKCCGRRVARLYIGHSNLFACRLCHGLTYASQSKNPRDRAIGRARKLRARLGGGPSVLDPVPEKPPRMHRRTYFRLSGKAMRAQERALGLLAEGMGWRFPSRAALAWADGFRQRPASRRRRFAPYRTAGPD